MWLEFSRLARRERQLSQFSRPSLVDILYERAGRLMIWLAYRRIDKLDLLAADKRTAKSVFTWCTAGI